MIKKLLCITILIILIFANVSIVYADVNDGSNGYYRYTNDASNCLPFPTSQFSSEYTFYNLEGYESTLIDMRQNLLNPDAVLPHYAFFARFNSGYIRINISMNMQIRYSYTCVGSYTHYNINYKELHSPNFVFDSGNFNTISENLTISNFSYEYAPLTGSGTQLRLIYNFELDFSCYMYIKDLLLTNIQDTSSSISDAVMRIYVDSSELGSMIYDTNNNLVAYQDGFYYRSPNNAFMSCELDNSVSNITGGCFGFDFYSYNNYYGTIGFGANAIGYDNTCLGETSSLKSRSFISAFNCFNIGPKSILKYIDTYSSSSNYANVPVYDNFLYQYQEESSNLTYNNTRYDLNLVILPLCLNTTSDTINNIESGLNQTHIDLQYYDAEWYEIHKQLANAFIFFITEFPLISDITNLIYGLFVMIQNGFNVLLEFDGFGIIFAFGMFVIVFGFIYKLIVGD